MNIRWGAVLYWLGCVLCTVFLAIGLHRWRGGEGWDLDLIAALALLLFNLGMFALAAHWREQGNGEFGLLPGLLWIGGKLFVNTFTLFLLIGLQAVSIRVFVPLFFIAYPLVLAAGILRLNIPLKPNETEPTG